MFLLTPGKGKMFRSILKAKCFVLLQTRALSATPTIVPHYVLFYQYVPDVATKRAPHRAGRNSSLLLSLTKLEEA
jgi:hypothetical protein